jgi:hydrogenase expression/formation protein HypE
MLGFDPLYVANEGKLVAIVGPEDAEKVLTVMRETRYGEEAAIIGEVVAEPEGKVLMKTTIGGTRIVHMLVGEMLPRIC